MRRKSLALAARVAAVAVPQRISDQPAASDRVLVARVEEVQQLLHVAIIPRTVQDMATCAKSEPVNEAGLRQLVERDRDLLYGPAQLNTDLGRSPHAHAISEEVNEDLKLWQTVYRSPQEKIKFALHDLFPTL